MADEKVRCLGREIGGAAVAALGATQLVVQQNKLKCFQADCGAMGTQPVSCNDGHRA
ncbi:hypothetical protein PSSHI_46610 [Photobacterium sp. R1]